MKLTPLTTHRIWSYIATRDPVACGELLAGPYTNGDLSTPALIAWLLAFAWMLVQPPR